MVYYVTQLLDAVGKRAEKKIRYFLLIGKPRKEIADQKSQRQILTHNLNFQG